MSIRILFLFLVFSMHVFAEFMYISTHGDDNNSGLSESSAIKTLKKALEVAQTMSLKDNKVSIIIAPDRSNNNIVEENYFYGFKKTAAIQESFCDKMRNKKCTKKSGECPSTGNFLINNDMVFDKLLDNRLVSLSQKYVYRPWCDKVDYNATRILIK